MAQNPAVPLANTSFLSVLRYPCVNISFLRFDILTINELSSYEPTSLELNDIHTGYEMRAIELAYK